MEKSSRDNEGLNNGLQKTEVRIKMMHDSGYKLQVAGFMFPLAPLGLPGQRLEERDSLGNFDFEFV